MFKNSTAYLTAIFMVCSISNAEATLTLKEVRSASRDVLVAFFTSDTTDVKEADIESISKWKINGQSPTNIFRYATQADACDHHIYLQTSELVEGANYQLETPYGSMAFRFSER